MGRIVSSEVPIGGVGYQYNVEGVEGVLAIITKHGPGIAAQGIVESLLLSVSLADGLFSEGQAESDVEYQRGYKEGFDRATAETRSCLIECDSELSAQGHGRPASPREELLRMSSRCRDLSKSNTPAI